jgi:hypothetical protein
MGLSDLSDADDKHSGSGCADVVSECSDVEVESAAFAKYLVNPSAPPLDLLTAPSNAKKLKSFTKLACGLPHKKRKALVQKALRLEVCLLVVCDRWSVGDYSGEP